MDGRGRLGRFSNNGSVVQRQGAHTVVWKTRVRLPADSFSFVSRQRVSGGRPSDAGASFLLVAAHREASGSSLADALFYFPVAGAGVRHVCVRGRKN